MRSPLIIIGSLLGVLVLALWIGLTVAASFAVAEGAFYFLGWDEGTASIGRQAVRYSIAILSFWTIIGFSACLVAAPARLFVKPGIYDENSVPVAVWYGLYHGVFAVVDLLVLRFVRGTIIAKTLYRGFGARIGKGTIVNTNQISDCYLVSIGNDTIIGADAVINPHSGERGRLHIRPIAIGDRVTIGQFAIILSGAVIEDDVVVGAHALVPKNSRLPRGGVFGGVPVRVIPPPAPPRRAGKPTLPPR